MPSNEPREAVTPPCLSGETHYWIIETAQGKTSPGRCKYCHETQSFENSVESKPGWVHPAGDGNHRDSWV